LAACSVSSSDRATSISIPSRSIPVEARIWVSPEAASTSLPAITSGRPALSRKTIASIRSGSTSAPLAAVSISSRQRAVRFAEASTPPGLFA
jgi:hypothetical protein